MSDASVSYKRHRFPREVIAYAVRLYLRFRLIEEMLLERRIIVSYDTIRCWLVKFGSTFARILRRKAARPGDVWQPDEVQIVIQSQPHWLWRAVGQDGCVVDEIPQTRRNTKAARRFLARLLKQLGPARDGWSRTN